MAKMRRAVWLWDKDTVAEALEENYLEGELPENFAGLDLLLGGARYAGPVLERSLTASDWNQTNAMLERVARMWLEDQAASGYPFILPEGAPRDGAVYLWGPKRVARFFAEDCPSLSSPPPQGLVGTRLLMQRTNDSDALGTLWARSEDDRAIVSAALGRKGLAFMRDFVRWQGQMAAVGGMGGSPSAEPDMQRALWMWTEDHVLRELAAMGSSLDGSRPFGLDGAAALLGTTRLEGEDAAKVEFLKVRVAREWLEDQAASLCPFRPSASELEPGLAYLWDADDARTFIETEHASGRFLGNLEALPADLTGQQLVIGDYDLPEEDREALRGVLAASALEFMRGYLESGAAESDAAAAARRALAQQPVSPDRARARKMRRAAWRWDAAQVHEAVKENMLYGQVPDGSTGRSLLNDGPWSEEMEEVLRRVTLLWLEDQAVLDVPYVLPSGAPLEHAVYLWDSRQVAHFFASDDIQRAGLQSEAPTWISGRQLLKQQDNMSTDDRAKVSDALSSIGLRFMRDFQRWHEAADPLFYGSLRPGMRRMMLHWNEVTVAEALGELELDGDIQNAGGFDGARLLLLERLGLPEVFSSEDSEKIEQLRLRIAGLFLRDQMLLERGTRHEIMLGERSPLEWSAEVFQQVIDDQRLKGVIFDEGDALKDIKFTVPQLLTGDLELSDRSCRILRHIVDSACLRLQQDAAVALEPHGYNWAESAVGLRLSEEINAREPSTDPMAWAVWRWGPGEATRLLGVDGVPEAETGRSLLRGEIGVTRAVHEAFQPALRRAALRWLEEQALSSAAPFDAPSEVFPRPVYLWGAEEVSQLLASAHEISSTVHARKIMLAPQGLTGRQLLRRLYSMPQGDEDVVLQAIGRSGLQFMKAMDLWEVSRNIGSICSSGRNSLSVPVEAAAPEVEATNVDDNSAPLQVAEGPPLAEAAAPVPDAESSPIEVEADPIAVESLSEALAAQAEAPAALEVAPEPLAAEAQAPPPVEAVPLVLDAQLAPAQAVIAEATSVGANLVTSVDATAVVSEWAPSTDATAMVAELAPSVDATVAPPVHLVPEFSAPKSVPAAVENPKAERPSSKGKAEQALVRVYSEGEMTPEIADSVKDQFKTYDKNGDGKISFDEFRNIMGSIGEFTGKELEDMFKKVDKSGDGDVSYEEFIDWVMTPDDDDSDDDDDDDDEE